MQIIKFGVAFITAMFILPASAKDKLHATKSGLQWTLSCQFPASAPAATATQQDFDMYSWQMFVALNWPAKAEQRGQPDCSKPIGAVAPVVWQTYKDVNQIFLSDGENPGPWSSGKNTTLLSMINIATLKNTNIVNAVDQAIGGWLIDQRGNPTYYEIAANETSYNYIVQNDFYNAKIVSKANKISFPNLATETKASWRILTGEDDASRYLTTQADVALYDEQGKATGNTAHVLLGLVGLHIITKAAGYPQWIWATFEQVDNVPPKIKVDDQWVNQPVTGIFYSYFNSAAPASALNQSPCNWHQDGNQPVCTPKPGVTFKTPNPLDRVTPITADTAQINSFFQNNLAQTVFKYYQLITTQRPLLPNNPGNPLGQPTPALSANVTMESYIQSTSSCMNCHSIATPVNSLYKADFSYLFKFAKMPATTTIKE